MYPRHYTDQIPAAGIRTKSGESAASCMIDRANFRGTERQLAFRNPRLDEPGQKLHAPGVTDSDPPPGLTFGVNSSSKNYTTSDCLHQTPRGCSKQYENFLDSKEDQYIRSRNRLGQVPVGVAQIPDELMKTGFGVSTKFGESAGAVIQGTHESTPNDPSLEVGYQTSRNYNWGPINPATHSFGIKGSSQVDHVSQILEPNYSSNIVPLAVDRANHAAIVQDPSPLDGGYGVKSRAMTARQVRRVRDPSELPPAGYVPVKSRLTIGDTISEMGCMDSFDVDRDIEERCYKPEEEIVHGVPTRPSPFPNPLKGPGRYANLGLSDEDFLKLRDQKHIVPVMVKALALTEDEAIAVFEEVATSQGRDTISVSEFYDAYKKHQW